ncbi:TetR/AcrR family transcriptional regulator [Rhodopseudomonas boonkerdii]|uniref:TetR/AcrR family transcriptional regulator n=1 Tax=Rhodopseudomonas boonkerdii TaxID=475937 RepID=UPI001E547840|nr:TetR/AcrR family transcriptional regulator [Rhodopseudomonas boonkerdii]UGV24363.1 TetR/AcrR family transcriptional regulator [Rhodopseudomonas boonkerdii]
MTEASTRDLLKIAARRLFALRGYDGVSVRDIVLAAGQRNSGSLHYYFGSKDELARELVADGAKLIDNRRNAMLDAIEARGGPRNLREIIECLVWPSTDLAGDGSLPPQEDTYIRFITMLQMSHRQMFMDALEGKWASGYERALAHLRAFMAEIDPDLVNQRLMLMSLYLRAAMSSREAALEGGASHRVWSAEATMENLIDTIEGMLRPKPSKATLQALARRIRRRAPVKRGRSNEHGDDLQAI